MKKIVLLVSLAALVGCGDDDVVPGSDAGTGDTGMLIDGGGEDTGMCTPSAEVCNGADDDCNGMVDDALMGASCPLTEGVCAGAVQRCGGALGFLDCDAASSGANSEAVEAPCDGMDTDCAGSTAESCPCAACATSA